MIVREVAVEFIDVEIVPQAFERYIGITVAINHILDYRDVLIAPASLVEPKCPVHLSICQ